MKPIVTLTLNPSIDASCQADTVHPIRKIRTSDERFDPGGGGINAARVIRELGGEAVAVYFAGGSTGAALTEQEAAAQVLVAEKRASMVAVSLGGDGALLATEAGCLRLKGPSVETKSAVGAGDSFVGAMTLGLAQGRPPDEAFTLAVAAGTAAVLTMGTELCRRDDVERIYEEIMAERESAARAAQAIHLPP